MSTADEVAAVAETLNHLELRKAELDVEVAALKGRLVQLLDVGESACDRGGNPLYRLAPGRRTFKQDKARALVPSDTLRLLTVETVDGAKLKRMSNDLWAACCDVGEPYLVVVR